MAEEKLLEFETYLFGLKGNKEGFLNIPTEHYELTNERLKITKQGMISKNLKDIELYKIKDIQVTQKLKDKMLGVGDIEITDADNNKINLNRIKDPHEIREKIRSAAKAAREAEGVSYRVDL